MSPHITNHSFARDKFYVYILSFYHEGDRTENQRMTVDRKLTYLFRLYSLVNQDIQTESCTADHIVCMPL